MKCEYIVKLENIEMDDKQQIKSNEQREKSDEQTMKKIHEQHIRTTAQKLRKYFKK